MQFGDFGIKLSERFFEVEKMAHGLPLVPLAALRNFSLRERVMRLNKLL